MYMVEALFFPTKIILIDDDQDFLKALSNHLSKSFQVEVFNDPNKALAYIKKNQNNFNIIDPSTFISEEDKELGASRLDLNKIHTFVDNKEKYNLTTVIISDYEYGMSEINGIIFFEQLINIPAMKIVLTGKADLELALDAFNRGLVNKFLVKNSKNMLEEILMNIKACQHSFFDKKSYPILSHINIPCDSLLNNNDYSFYLINFIQNFNIKEYYLIDVIGSFLLIRKTGESVYFMCMIERQFDEYLDIAITSRASTEVIEGLKKRTKSPVFISEDDYQLSPKNWTNIMYSFEKKDGYYFCLIEK